MDFAWESICNFGSLRERDCFLAWMRGQIADGVAEEIEAPAGFDASERWFRHIPTGSLWRLVPAENLYGPASGLLTTRPPKTRAASVGDLSTISHHPDRHLVPVEVGAHFGPRLPHAPQTKPILDVGQPNIMGPATPLIATEWLHL